MLPPVAGTVEKLTATDPMPEPEAPLLMVIQKSLVDAAQEQPAGATTAIVVWLYDWTKSDAG